MHPVLVYCALAKATKFRSKLVIIFSSSRRYQYSWVELRMIRPKIYIIFLSRIILHISYIYCLKSLKRIPVSYPSPVKQSYEFVYNLLLYIDNLRILSPMFFVYIRLTNSNKWIDFSCFFRIFTCMINLI